MATARVDGLTLGYEKREIDDLLDRGVVYEPTDDYRWPQ